MIMFESCFKFFKMSFGAIEVVFSTVTVPAGLPFSIAEREADLRDLTNDPTRENNSNKQQSPSNLISKSFRPLWDEEMQVTYFPNGLQYLIFPTRWQISGLWQSLYLRKAPSTPPNPICWRQSWAESFIRSKSEDWVKPMTRTALISQPQMPLVRNIHPVLLTNIWILWSSSIFNLPSLFISLPTILHLFHLYPSLCHSLFL